jgi:hypothetical protein
MTPADPAAAVERETAAAQTPAAGRGVAEVAICFLESMQRGTVLPSSGVRADRRDAMSSVQASLLRAMPAIIYWMRNGVVRDSEDGGFEIVQPAPAAVIAGWIPNLFPLDPAIDPAGSGATLALISR